MLEYIAANVRSSHKDQMHCLGRLLEQGPPTAAAARASASGQPSSVASETARQRGAAAQNAMSRLPHSPPAQKATSVITIRVLPPPTV